VKIIKLLFTLLVFYQIFAPPKVLHLTFHQGCANEIKSIAKNFKLNLTTWHIPSLSPKFFDPESQDNTLYNIGHDRAIRIWNKHKDFFNQFDAIITSDTAPLSRIFLQNNFQKPLIIWICNRFDYCDRPGLDCSFPDQEYYQLINKAQQNHLVSIIPNTQFEIEYAKRKGVNLGNFIIKPSGTPYIEPHRPSNLPSAHINKSQTFFIPRYNNEIIRFNLPLQCNILGIQNYNKRYYDALDLQGFKGIIHIPYAYSTIALFENLQLGMPYFIPSPQFMLLLMRTNNLFFQNKDLFESNYRISEWYCKKNRPFFVYFNSWSDLQRRIRITKYQRLRQRILTLAKKHKDEMLRRWQQIFHAHNLL